MPERDKSTESSSGGNFLLRKSLWEYLYPIFIFSFATLLTDARDWSDTSYYVTSVIERLKGNLFQYWEFGHLLWRPIGFWTASIFGIQAGTAAEIRLEVSKLYEWLNWCLGLLAALGLWGIISHATKNLPVRIFALFCFVFSQSLLNFTQTGAAYVPSLGFLTLGTWLLLGSGRSVWQIFCSSLCFALSVLIWTPFVLSVPGMLLVHGLATRSDSFSFPWKKIFAVAFLSAGMTLVFFGYGALKREVNSVQDLRAWVHEATHEKISHGGFQRVVFGFSNSLLAMGDFGKLVKRYQRKDPFNPVTIRSLFGKDVLRLGIVSLFVLTLLLSIRSAAFGPRELLPWAVLLVPNLAFAVYFDGGSLERYLYLLPFLWLTVAILLDSERVRPYQRMLLYGMLPVMLINNLPLYARPAVLAHEEKVRVRLGELPNRIHPPSFVVVLLIQDDILALNKGFIFSPSRPFQTVGVHPLLMIGSGFSKAWKHSLSEHALETWKAGGEVWLSKRLFADSPRPEWGWVEGEDQFVGWNDIHEFFLSLDTTENIGGEDGFILLQPSEKNENLLRSSLNPA